MLNFELDVEIGHHDVMRGRAAARENYIFMCHTSVME